jgi:hypothetical protein
VLELLHLYAQIFTWRLPQKRYCTCKSIRSFTTGGAVVLRDRRGTVKADIPDADEKSFGSGSDPLAIYKPTGTKTVDAAKAMAAFTGWTYAAGAIAAKSRISNYALSGRWRRPRGSST